VLNIGKGIPLGTAPRGFMSGTENHIQRTLL